MSIWESLQCCLSSRALQLHAKNFDTSTRCASEISGVDAQDSLQSLCSQPGCTSIALCTGQGKSKPGFASCLAMCFGPNFGGSL